MKEKTGSKNNDVKSMTGYGRSTGETDLGRITVEVRSLNHRHLDVTVRASRNLMHLEPAIRNMIRERVSRGKVEVFMTFEVRPPQFVIDIDRALEVARSLEKVASSIGDTVRLEHVLAVGEITQTGEREVDDETGSVILQAAGDALGNMIEHRVKEGKALALDLASRLVQLDGICEEIDRIAPNVPVRARENTIQFLEKLELGERVDPQRIEMEIAIQAQRADISEEITRLAAHRESLLQTLSGGGVIGRRLDFLIQEIHREINTIGSKSGMPEISAKVVDFKSGLEKMREQVQNIE